MGMAASQARLLSITARLTNNENTGQSVSYAKQRLADQTQQITNEYNEALDATKLTVLTGFNGADANYTDISYNLMTGMQMAESMKQYVVTDTKGRILVTNEIADAYEQSRGNYNTFLGALKINDGKDKGKSYSQADIYVQKTYTDEKDRTPEQKATEQQIHEAWDKYFETVGITLGDDEHDFGFSWTETVNPDTGEYAIGDGYAGYRRVQKDENGNIVYNKIPKKDQDGNEVKDDDGNSIMMDIPAYVTAQRKDSDGNPVLDEEGNPILDNVYDPINYEGTTPESRDLYDYAMALTEAYLRVGTGDNGKTYEKQYDLNNFKSAADPDNASELKYYRNIFDKIQACGYFTYTDTPAKIDKNHLYTSSGTGNKGDVQKSPLDDNYTFEQALRDGTLRLEYYSSTDKAFRTTTISEDNCIQEVKDERAIAKAETKYTQDMADLENKDNKFDLELKRLDTEHKALETEYESVKNVVDKNVESSFKIFS